MSLTLNIQDKELIEEAKSFAKSQNKSLSVLVENVLRGFVKQPKGQKQDNNKLLGAFVLQKALDSDESDLKWEYLKEKYEL